MLSYSQKNLNILQLFSEYTILMSHNMHVCEYLIALESIGNLIFGSLMVLDFIRDRNRFWGP